MSANTKQARERRRHTRHAVETDVQVGNGLRMLNGRVRDISAGGVAIHWLDILETPDLATPPGHLVHLYFRAGIAVTGYVTGTDPRLIHVAFEINDVDLATILADLKSATGADLHTG